MRLEKEDIERLRDISVEDVAQQSFGLDVQRHRCLCCFHTEKRPSLSFSTARNSFRCWSCGAHGSGAIDFVMQATGMDFQKACEYLAGQRGVIISRLPPQPKQTRQYPPDTEFLSSLVARPVLTPEARTFLYEERLLLPEVVEWVGISSLSIPAPCWRWGKNYFEAPCLLFPYRSMDGAKSVVNVQSRYLGTDRNVPRFRQPPHANVHMFNLPILNYLKPREDVYLSEGITDCFSLLSDHRKAVACPSATLLCPDDLKLLQGHDIHTYLDKDDAGRKFYEHLLRLGNELGICVIKHELPEDDQIKDYSDFYVARHKTTIHISG